MLYNFPAQVPHVPFGYKHYSLEVPVPPTRVQTVQPPRVDTEGPSYNFRLRGKKTPIPLFALTAQFPKPHEANAVTHQISGVAQEYRHLIKGPERKIWEISFADELGQLAQGIRGLKGTNTFIFIIKAQVPKDKKVTYGKILCEVKPDKKEKERIRLTLGGNLLDFTGNLSAPTASFTT